MLDQQFHVAVVRAAHRRALELLKDDGPDILSDEHRVLMREAKVLLSLVAAGEATGSERAGVVEAATARVNALRSLQSDSGLFVGGNNLQSPPDSAFTINDACDTYASLVMMTGESNGQDGESALGALLVTLESIIRDATEPLLRGGVHTPNHRWEISAALARIHRSFPDERLVSRVNEWLAEGIDVDQDGWYSERSPNYAAHVSNPSLTAIARILNLPELDAIVLRNLETTLSLIRPDDTVETVQSRRQDQGARFPLAPYLAFFRAAALSTGRGDFAAAARRAASPEIADPELLAETLLNPALIEGMPQEDEPSVDASYFFDTVALAGRRSRVTESVVYGGSDYAAHRRVRSGLANNPTFCRVFAGEAILDSVRLSRAFFDLGPFRAATMRPTDDGYVLEEELEAAYYQPLDAADRRADGRYDLVDDGRFSASMSFPLRRRDDVAMSTVVAARLLKDGVDLKVGIDAPELGWSLEFGFRDGGTLEGGVLQDDGTWVLPSGHGVYRAGRSSIHVAVEGADLTEHPLPYQPGQDYEFLGATDAVDGVRVRVGGVTPTSFLVRIRAEQEVAR
ncbi:hypothetical protein GCM10027568_17590 [Humibacter soli]